MRDERENAFGVKSGILSSLRDRLESREFISERLGRKTIAVILVLLAIVAVVSGGYVARRLKESFRETTLYPTPEQAVTAEIHKELTDDGGISAEINDICLDADETARALPEMRGSEAAAALGRGGEALDGNFMVCRARWYAQYSDERDSVKNGMREEWFYLILDAESGQWSCVKTAPVPPGS